MLMLGMFVCSQVALALVIWGVARFVDREPDLCGRLGAVREVRFRPSRMEAAQREAEWTGDELRTVDADLERAQARRAQFDPLPDSAVSIGWFVFLTFAMFEGEAAVALLLNISAGFGRMPEPVAAFVSPIIAAALFAVLHVVLGGLIEIGVAYRPQRLIRRARVGAVIGTAIVIAAAWLVLSGRSLSDPTMVETLASTGVLVLALVLSVAGAFASLVVTIQRSEETLDRRLTRLERRKTALERHQGAVRAELDELIAETPRRPSTALRRAGASGAGTTTIVLVLLAAMPGLGCVNREAAAQASSPLSPIPIADEEPPAVALNACELLLDVSKSVDATARDEAVERVAGQLTVVVATFGCTVLRFSAFIDGSLPLQEVALPVVTTLVPCRDKRGPAERRSAVDELYPELVRRRLDVDRQQCEAEARRRHDEQQRSRMTALEAAAQVWGDLARKPIPPADCTALDDVVARAVGRSHHTLVVTDGRNTCQTRARPAAVLPELTAGRSLTFLLVPPEGPDAAERGRGYEARLAREYPTSRVRPVGELTPTTWLSLQPHG